MHDCVRLSAILSKMNRVTDLPKKLSKDFTIYVQKTQKPPLQW